MTELSFPIYVREKDDGSLMEFLTKAAIEQHLEAIDVENDEYEAWDVTGRCLELKAGKTRRAWLTIVPLDRHIGGPEFEAIKIGAEKRKEYASTPLLTRVRNWFGTKASS